MGRFILKLPGRLVLTFIIAGTFAGMAMAQQLGAGVQPETAKKATVKTEAPKPAATAPEKAEPQKSAPAAAPDKSSDAKADAPAAKTGDEAGDTAPDTDNAEVSGLPVPRFVSLRTDPINLRSGPGLQYPVEWVYHRRHLPVEVVKEFDTWRRIRDQDGAEGWVHQSMITGHRTAVVRGSAQALRRNDGDEAGAIATLEAGVVVNVQRCPAGSQSCRVEINGLQGWLKRDQMWGVYPTETVE
jgi:SH3-like domain-containing protein